MQYRRFRTSDGQYLDALLTAETEFSVPPESHRADHEAGYGIAPLTVVDADADPWDGTSPLLHAPPRPVPPPTKRELALEALRAIDPDSLTTVAGLRAAFKVLHDAVLGEPQVDRFSVVQTEGLDGWQGKQA